MTLSLTLRITFLALVLAMSACTSDRQAPPDISGIQADITLVRFDSVLGSAHPDSLHILLPAWRKEYAYLLDNPLPDSQYVMMIRAFIEDPMVREAMRKSAGTFNNSAGLRDELAMAFRYLRYYFPELKLPTVYTYISGFDLNYAVKYSDTAMAIGLDMYLGKGFMAYRNLRIPKYQQHWMEPSCLARDCISEVFTGHYHRLYADPTLLDHIVDRARRYAFIAAAIPALPDTLLLKYTADQLEWCEDHEREIWALLIGEDLLFSRDQQKTGRFLHPAPFTQGLGNDSPGRLADFIGYRMALSYLGKKADASLRTMMETDNSEEFLRDSRYKPRR